MAVYIKCQTCSGSGFIRCGTCLCKDCESKGKIKCATCSNGRVACSSCNHGKAHCEACGATGEQSSKFLFFTFRRPCLNCKGSKTVSCYVCGGSGSILCSICKGEASVTCSACNGKGAYSECSQCYGTQKLACQNCSGKGKLESEWLKSLRDLPVDRLRFEYEKRQRGISNVQMQVSSVQRQFDELQQEWGDAYDEAAAQGSAGVTRFDASGFQSGTAYLYKEMDTLNGRIGELKAEMKAIDRVIGSKWK